jgi:uncharacterized alpha-E superfamily protein
MLRRMLRVALPEDEQIPAGIADPRDGRALALLQAVGGFQAYRRAVPAPPKAGPVASFLLYERSYPDSVAHSVHALHAALEDADVNARKSAPVLRLGRLMADLVFRFLSSGGDAAAVARLAAVQNELALVDGDIAQRYFGGAAAPVQRLAIA